MKDTYSFDTSPDDLRETLTAAKMAELLAERHTDAALALVEDLAHRTEAIERCTGGRKNKRSASAHTAFMRTIAALAHDLLLHASNDEAEGYCYRSMRSDSFGETLSSRRHYGQVFEAWRKGGLIEVHMGCRYVDDCPEMPSELFRKATRLRATQPLLAIAEANGIGPQNVSEHFSTDYKALSKIILRDSNGDNIKPESSARLDELEAEVEEITDFLAQQTFTGINPPRLRRIFNRGDDPNFDWNVGGRFYTPGGTGYTTMKSHERAKITINGEPVVEVDAGACALHTYLALHNDLPEDVQAHQIDLYGGTEWPRELVKTAVTAAFGNGCAPKRWPNGAKAELAEKLGASKCNLPSVKEVWASLCGVYRSLCFLKESGLDSSKLSYIESEAFKEAMLKLKRDFGVPSLPVFDCLIVLASEVEKAKLCISVGFSKQGIPCPRLSAK